ncbi:MAG: haloacid dehalogenase-like hydrolase [Ignavibacteria bacterium]|nr:haloacid dehalogenase-like hydrolase [Ignavibacteria bacterium]
MVNINNIAAFYDLDKTIIRQNLYSIFFNTFIKKSSKILAKFYIPVLFVLSKLFKNNEFIRHGMIWSLSGYNKKYIQLEWREYLKANLDTIMIKCIQESIENHLSANHKLFILTNNIDVLVGPLAELLGFTDYRAINVSVDSSENILSTSLLKKISIDKKMELFNLSTEYKIDLSKSFGYGDSIEDYEFLRELTSAYLLNKDQLMKFNK